MWAFENPLVWSKISEITKNCELALQLKQPVLIANGNPARDIQVLEARFHPGKKSLHELEGQARLLHDVAAIELQAMELGLRTLVEFPDAPAEFREQLMAVTISEAQHLRLCLDGIADLGFQWGDWPVHCALWAAVGSENSLLDRILIVHRYLEGSGLDAGDVLLKRLDSAGEKKIKPIIQQINREEIDHVNFGSHWYREICKREGRDPNTDFPVRMKAVRESLPKRIEKINPARRKLAGFTDAEITFYESLRSEFLIPYKKRSQVVQN